MCNLFQYLSVENLYIMILLAIIKNELGNMLIAHVQIITKITNMESLGLVQQLVKFEYILFWNVQIVIKLTK